MAKAEYYLSKLLKKLRLKAVTDSRVSPLAHIHSGSHVVSSEVGRYTDIGYDCEIIHAKVGSFCSVAARVIIGGESHPVEYVSTSTVFLSLKDTIKTKFADLDYECSRETTVGNDVWIGHGAIVKAGVHIGSGAVIGMGSVVTKDVPAYEIWAGNPARCIRKRFDDETAARLERAAWWDYDEEKLRRCGPLFRDPKAFLDAAEKESR